MNDNYSKVEKISNDGYDLEFGTIFEKAFNTYKLMALIGGVGLILISIIVVILYAGVFGAFYGFSDVLTSLKSINPEVMSSTSLLYFLLFTIVMSGFMNPIYAGFVNMAFLADTNKDFGLGTIFAYYKGAYFKELFAAGAIIAFFGSGLNYLFDYLGIKYVGIVITCSVAFVTFLTIPLIIFSNLKAIEAITMSVKLVIKRPLILFGLLFVSLIVACLGIFGFCIGIFFTIPFIYVMYYTIYEAIIPLDEKTELDEIGQNHE